MKWTDGVDGVYTGDLEQYTLNAHLRDAVQSGTSQDVRYWIDQGAIVNPEQIADSSTSITMPLLHLATICQRPTVAEVLVGADPKSVEKTDMFGRTALHVAALEGYDDMTHVLLQMGVDPAAKDRFGFSAAELAQARGNDAVLDVMQGSGVPLKLRRNIDALRNEVAAAYPLSERPFTVQVRPPEEAGLGPDFPTGIPIR